MFCPQRTASLSIARSWSCLQTPVLHTHDLCRFVVFDKRSSPFLDFVRVHFGVELVVDLPVESVPDFDVDFEHDFDGMIQYTVEVLDKAKTCLLFKFFGSLKFVTSVRNPLATRVIQFLESITVEHVNSVMDELYPECKRLRLQPAVVAELCHFRQKIKKKARRARSFSTLLTSFRLENACCLSTIYTFSSRNTLSASKAVRSPIFLTTCKSTLHPTLTSNTCRTVVSTLASTAFAVSVLNIL